MTLEAQDRSECLTPAMATATDECIETHFSMRPPDAILVYGTTFGPVPISEWDKHVESVKGLVAESSKVFQLPPPKVEVLRRDGGSLRPLSHDR